MHKNISDSASSITPCLAQSQLIKPIIDGCKSVLYIIHDRRISSYTDMGPCAKEMPFNQAFFKHFPIS